MLIPYKISSGDEKITKLAASRGKRKILETLNIDTATGEEVEEPFHLLKKPWDGL